MGTGGILVPTSGSSGGATGIALASFPTYTTTTTAAASVTLTVPAVNTANGIILCSMVQNGALVTGIAGATSSLIVQANENSSNESVNFHLLTGLTAGNNSVVVGLSKSLDAFWSYSFEVQNLKTSSQIGGAISNISGSSATPQLSVSSVPSSALVVAAVSSSAQMNTGSGTNNVPFTPWINGVGGSQSNLHAIAMLQNATSGTQTATWGTTGAGVYAAAGFYIHT